MAEVAIGLITKAATVAAPAAVAAEGVGAAAALGAGTAAVVEGAGAAATVAETAAVIPQIGLQETLGVSAEAMATAKTIDSLVPGVKAGTTKFSEGLKTIAKEPLPPTGVQTEKPPPNNPQTPTESDDSATDKNKDKDTDNKEKMSPAEIAEKIKRLQELKQRRADIQLAVNKLRLKPNKSDDDDITVGKFSLALTELDGKILIFEDELKDIEKTTVSPIIKGLIAAAGIGIAVGVVANSANSANK